MDKVILVMNDPMFCCNYQLARMRRLRGGYVCAIARQTDKDCYWEKVDMKSETKPDWCPLKPVPEKYDVLAAIENNPNYDPSYDVGRNDCIDEILGN